MKNSENFIPHDWGKNIDNNFTDSNKSISDSFPNDIFSESESKNKPTDINDMFGVILGRVEQDVQKNEVSQPDPELQQSRIVEDMSGESEEAAYTQGYMDGVSKQRDDTEKELLKASSTVKDIKNLILDAKVELDAEIDAALKSFLTQAAKSVLGDIIDDNTASIINQKLAEFISENGFVDYKISLTLSKSDYTVFKNMENIDVSFSESNTLGKGQARLVASGKNGIFHAEFDAHNAIQKQLDDLI